MTDLDPERFTLRQATQARDDFAQIRAPVQGESLCDSPLEGDGLELLVPRQKSPGFPKHPGSGRDGRGPMWLTLPSPSSHQAPALGRADTSPYQRVRFARPESTVSPTTAPSPSATIAVMSAIV